MKEISFLKENISLDFTQKKSEGILADSVKDELYRKFVFECNGGYYFNNSLHIFGFSSKNQFHDISYMNSFVENHFSNIYSNLYFFAEDIFGNLFAFSKKGIILFNIETGEQEYLAPDFKKWIGNLKEDLDYLTGANLVLKLSSAHKKQLAFGKRLAPKLPFVVGGQYTIENLVLKDFKENLEFNSQIALQVFNIPDNTKIRIKID